MTSCVHCLDIELIEMPVKDLNIVMYSAVANLIKKSFNRTSTLDLHRFDTVVMALDHVVTKSFFGFEHTKSVPVAVMLVKETEPVAELPKVTKYLNLTCVCVHDSLRCQGLGSNMMRWFLDAQTVGTAVYLHVDKLPVQVQICAGKMKHEEAWRNMVLQPLQSEEPNDFVLDTGTADISSYLVNWYAGMGFREHYTNDHETCMLYLAHKDALEYESDDWQSTDVTDGELGHGDFVTQEFDGILE